MKLKKKLDHHAKEILSKSAIAFVLKIIGAALAFFLQVVIARYLGASDAGIYFIAFTIVTLFATVARLGMDNSVTRYVAAHASEQDWSKVTGVVRQAIRISLVVSIFLSIILFFQSDWIANKLYGKTELVVPLKIMSLVIAPLSVMTIYASALQGLKKVAGVVLLQSILIPLIALAAMLYLAPAFGIQGVALAYGLGVGFSLGVGIWLWQTSSSAWIHRTSEFSAKLLLSSSVTLLWAVLLQQLSLAIPMLFLGVWGSSAEAGIFSAAQRTANLIGLVLIAANIIVAPKFAELYQQRNMEGLGRLARQGALLMSAMALPALVLFIVAPKWVMGLFGAEFVEGWLLLVIMALGQLINVMTGSVGLLLIMTGNEKKLLSASWISLGVCLILSLMLIPRYESAGAAIAGAASIAITNLIRVRFVSKTLGIMTIPLMK